MIQPRETGGADLGFLEEMLFEAFFWSPSLIRPPLEEFRGHPEFRKLLAGWGRPGDQAIVAEEGDRRVGAAWYRLWTPECHSYGFVDAGTPEIALAVAPGWRGRGIGRALLRAIIEAARADGFGALSLSVDPANHALQLYESEGFHRVGESGTSWTLELRLAGRGLDVE